MRRNLFQSFGFALLAFGCAGGQSGDLSGNNDGGEGTLGGQCEEHEQKLGGFDEPTDAGTAEQILAFAERSFEAPLSWKTAQSGAWELSATGADTIHLDVTRGASAYYVTYTPKQDDSGIEIGVSCPQPALGIEVHIDVTSDSGALAESYDTLLLATSSELATLYIPIKLDELGGTLAVNYSNPNTELVQASLSATLMAEGMTGSFSAIEQTMHGSGPDGAVSAGAGGVLAVWPDSPACAQQHGPSSGLGVTADQNALGITGDAAATLVSDTTPAAVTWVDGTETELTLTATIEGDGCLRAAMYSGLEDGAAGSVTYPARFQVSSADGRLEGEYLGTLVTSPNGDQHTIGAEATLELAPDQVAQSGFTSVEVPEGVHRIAAALSVTIEDGQVSGWVRLNALTDPPCLTDPPEPMETPGGGMSVPGCEGTHVQQLEIGVWLAP
ncbi:MAG TPA: hypothetical protein VJN18_09790 [Polyangiaceae bacterium]|nr:hypothetical protein [Polyangiaceae bacterium]